MNKRLRSILIASYFALVFVFFGINIYISSLDQLKMSITGLDIKENTKQVRIDRTLTENPAAAVVRDGDELVAFNGQPFVVGQRQISNFERARPGTPYTITIERNAQLQEFELRTVPIPLVRVVVFKGLSFVVFSFFLFTGLIVLLLKPDDKLALLLALMLGLISGGGYSRETLEAQPIYFAAAVLINFLRMFVPVIFLHFFLVFPERSPLLQRFPRFEWMIYPLWFLLSVLYTTYIMLLDMTAPERVYEATQRLIVLGWTETIVSLIYVFGGLISLIVNYRQANTQSQRKLRVVLFGTLAGLLPVLGFSFVD